MRQLENTPYHVRVFTVRDVPADVFISKYAQHLKDGQQFEVPKWVDYVKTSHAKELAPYDQDWLYIRAASIIRHLYIRPDTGVGDFRKIYGGKKRRGSRPPHHCRASGKIIRHCLQQFQKLKLIEEPNEQSAGRRLSSEGQKALDQIAAQCK